MPLAEPLDDEDDEALPPRGVNSLSVVVSVIAIGFCGYLLYDSRSELAYWFASPEPIELGGPKTFTLERELSGRFARVEGAAGGSAERYERFGKRREIIGIPGTNVLVDRETSIPATSGKAEPGPSKAVSVAAGRLVRDDEAPGYYLQALPKLVAQGDVEPLGGHLYVLVDGEKPRTGMKAPAIALALLLLIAVNLRSLFRALR